MLGLQEKPQTIHPLLGALVQLTVHWCPDLPVLPSCARRQGLGSGALLGVSFSNSSLRLEEGLSGLLVDTVSIGLERT